MQIHLWLNRLSLRASALLNSHTARSTITLVPSNLTHMLFACPFEVLLRRADRMV